jgi:hypothetical protein
MTPSNFFCQSKLIFSDETCPTKKPDSTFSGHSFRVIKTIPKNLLFSYERRECITSQGKRQVFSQAKLQGKTSGWDLRIDQGFRRAG